MREFTLVFGDGLVRGLRKQAGNPTNEQALVISDGLFPHERVSQALEDLTEYQVALGSIEAEFPFPQVFVLRQMTLVCTATEIYKLVAGTLTLLHGLLEAGTTWTVADYDAYVVMTNGKVLLVRDALSGEFNVFESCYIPPCICLCDLNGQLIVGGPGAYVTNDFPG